MALVGPSSSGVDFTAEAMATGDDDAVDLQDLTAFFLFGGMGTMCVVLRVVVALVFLAGNFLAAVTGTLWDSFVGTTPCGSGLDPAANVFVVAIVTPGNPVGVRSV